MEIVNISLPNFDSLKKELIFNWHLLEDKGYNRPNNPYWIKIYDLLNAETDLPELELAKQYLNQFNLNTFQIVVYLPYARTGFHIDGGVHRYVIPIVSSKNAINFELDKILLSTNPSNREVVDRFNNHIGWNSEPTLYGKERNFDWLEMDKYNNKMFVIDENQCIKIGNNWHAHMNNHYQHRIIIVFDSKRNIVLNG